MGFSIVKFDVVDWVVDILLEEGWEKLVGLIVDG